MRTMSAMNGTPGCALAAILAAAVMILAGCAAGRAAGTGGGDMPYPPPSPVKAGEIYHLPTGLRMSLDNAMEILSGARLVGVGETHDNLQAKKVFAGIVRELHRRSPGKVAIGMEMFREPQQEVLDRWVRGELTERQFLKEAKWLESWGFDFAYYREILLFAKENRIDVLALNPSKEIQSAVRRSGMDNVSEDLKAKIPQIDDTDPYQRAVVRALYGDHVSSEGAFNAFYRVQLLWEETMAQRIVDYLRSPRGEGKRIVTLTGGWHVRYGFGLPKKVVRRMPMPYAVVLPEEVDIPPGREEQLMDVTLPEVPLLPADFYWWVPYEDLEGQRVRMGVHIAGKDNAVVVEGVSEGSPAEKAGVRTGDILVSLDGAPVEDATDVQIVVNEKKEGDRMPLVVRREGEEKALEITFFKMPKKKAH